MEQLKEINLDLKEELTEVKQAYLMMKDERESLRRQIAEYKVKFKSFNQILKEKVDKALENNSIDLQKLVEEQKDKIQSLEDLNKAHVDNIKFLE